MKTIAIIPAAGSGTRMGAETNKLFLHLDKKPILIHTLEVFEASQAIDGVLLVVKPEEELEILALLKEHKIQKVIKCLAGGAERQDSIQNAIAALPKDATHVVVHDGARPFIKPSQVNDLVDQLKEKSSVIMAVPAKDTVKRVSPTGLVNETLDRSELWQIQTPQGFEREAIERAYELARTHRYRGTDDASLMENAGLPVHVTLGDYQNIKVTTEVDLVFGEAILKHRQGSK